MIKCIFFDIDGVLTNNHFTEFYHNFADEIGLSREKIDSICNQLFEDLILGHISAEQFFNLIRDAANFVGHIEPIFLRHALK